jgi:hypothetical protein
VSRVGDDSIAFTDQSTAHDINLVASWLLNDPDPEHHKTWARIAWESMRFARRTQHRDRLNTVSGTLPSLPGTSVSTSAAVNRWRLPEVSYRFRYRPYGPRNHPGIFQESFRNHSGNTRETTRKTTCQPFRVIDCLPNLRHLEPAPRVFPRTPRLPSSVRTN